MKTITLDDYATVLGREFRAACHAVKPAHWLTIRWTIDEEIRIKFGDSTHREFVMPIGSDDDEFSFRNVYQNQEILDFPIAEEWIQLEEAGLTSRKEKGYVPVRELNEWLHGKLKEADRRKYYELTGEDPREVRSNEDDPFDVGYFLSECVFSPKFVRFLHEHGLGLGTPWGGEELIYFDERGFEAIDAETKKIQDEYDHSREGQPTWEKYELRGDDMVDYCGGYIQIVLDILRTWIDRGNATEIIHLR